MQSERDLAGPGAGERSGASPGARLGAWILLYGALAASAGHGLFLYARLTRHDRLMPNWGYLQRAVGDLGTASIGWFLAAIPLALLALPLRRRLQRLGWLWPLALAVGGLSLAAFACYASMMIGAPGR